MNERAFAIVPAAGSSRRMQSTTPKQYALLKGKPILWHVLNTLTQTGLFDTIVLVLAEHDTQGHVIASQFSNILIAPGGPIRLASVLSGVNALQAQDQDWVFVHDAARPYVTVEDIQSLYESIQSDPVGGILGSPVRDTLKRVASDQRIVTTVDRSVLWHAMTPQAFRYHLMKRELALYLEKYAPTDDRAGIEECAVMEQAGHQPLMVRGRSDNIKITYPEDLIMHPAGNLDSSML